MHVKYAKKVYYRQDKRCPVFLFPEAKVNSVCERTSRSSTLRTYAKDLFCSVDTKKKLTLILCTTSLTLSKRVVFKSS